jgi:branched-subunit amino acid ABC-type transport system permease component
MRALPHHYPLKAKIGFLNIFVAIIGIVVCFAITQHYVNLKPVGKETVNSLLPSIDFQAPSILSGETFSITFWAKYKILLFALVVLLLVLMVDQLWRKRTYWGRASKVIMI